MVKRAQPQGRSNLGSTWSHRHLCDAINVRVLILTLCWMDASSSLDAHREVERDTGKTLERLSEEERAAHPRYKEARKASCHKLSAAMTLAMAGERDYMFVLHRFVVRTLLSSF